MKVHGLPGWRNVTLLLATWEGRQPYWGLPQTLLHSGKMVGFLTGWVFKGGGVTGEPLRIPFGKIGER